MTPTNTTTYLSQTGHLLTLLQARYPSTPILVEAEKRLADLWRQWTWLETAPRPNSEDPTKDYEALTQEAVRLELELARLWVQA